MYGNILLQAGGRIDSWEEEAWQRAPSCELPAAVLLPQSIHASILSSSSRRRQGSEQVTGERHWAAPMAAKLLVAAVSHGFSLDFTAMAGRARLEDLQYKRIRCTRYQRRLKRHSQWNFFSSPKHQSPWDGELKAGVYDRTIMGGSLRNDTRIHGFSQPGKVELLYKRKPSGRPYPTGRVSIICPPMSQNISIPYYMRECPNSLNMLWICTKPRNVYILRWSI